MCVSGVCGGKLNSKFSRRVAARTCISIMLKAEINPMKSRGEGDDIRKTPSKAATNSSSCQILQDMSICRQKDFD